MPVRTQTILKWLQQAINDDQKDGKCTAIALVHMVGMVEREIWTCRLDGSTKYEYQELANQFTARAESYCEELPGVQRCCLLAFYGINLKEPQARKPFNVTGVSEFDGLATEGPTNSGLVQQSMRHMEAVVQVCQRQTSILFASSQEMMGELSRQNLQLMRENREAHVLLIDILRQQAAGQHDMRLAELRAQSSNDLKQQVMKLLPSVVNSLTGRELFPENTEDTALVESIVNNTSPEQLEQLLNAPFIPQQVRALLSARIERMVRGKLDAESGQKRLENGVDPETEVMGGSP